MTQLGYCTSPDGHFKVTYVIKALTLLKRKI